MIRVADIQAAVAERYHVPTAAMTSQSRAHAMAHPRQVAMFLARELTAHSLPSIGRMFGGRDHTTVIHAIQAVANRAETYAETADDLTALRERLGGER